MSLFIVATPIGNPEDITLRALNVLRECDVVLCEELRQGSTLLKKIGVIPRSLLAINEHTELNLVPEIITRLLRGENLALISDSGTPVFADPGYHLIQSATQQGIKIVPIPGPSSLMAALSVLDFQLKKYIFGGFLSQKQEERSRELGNYKRTGLPVVLMDTPYRLKRLLEDVQKHFGSRQHVTLTCDLTLPSEIILRGEVSQVLKQVGARKAEFILIID